MVGVVGGKPTLVIYVVLLVSLFYQNFYFIVSLKKERALLVF